MKRQCDGEATRIPRRADARWWRRSIPLALVAVAVAGIVTTACLEHTPRAAAQTRVSPPRVSRTADAIRETLDQGPHAGECERCHTMHAGEDVPQPFALVGPDDNSLCVECHTEPWKGGSFPDTWTYARSAHGQDPNVIWPGPDPAARTEPGAAGKCVNCHEPHGWSDALGLIPGLLNAREEALCLRCHNGAPAVTNVGVDFTKPYTHPLSTATGRHTGPLESAPTDFGAAPLNRRHAECADCHNPHFAIGDEGSGPVASELSRRNLGVSRVRVVQGSAGSIPAYFFTAGSDTLTPPLAEHQLCYKCHSSWTNLPPGQTDLARVLNPANPSYHPVEAQGRDQTIQMSAFTPGWSASSITRCGHCHGSDFGTTGGPHGSNYRYILRRPYTASPASRMMGVDEICFECHAWEVYADPSSPEVVRSASRFNGPQVGAGHAEHVGERDVPCFACHATHGSTTLPHLIATGRSPGILSYTESATGGTCTPTCHGPETYSVNYGR